MPIFVFFASYPYLILGDEGKSQRRILRWTRPAVRYSVSSAKPSSVATAH